MSPTSDDAAHFVLKALKSRAPHLLEELRDAAGDDDVAIVNEWAQRHQLKTPLVTNILAKHRAWWRKYPQHASGLELGGIARVITGWMPSPREMKWVQQHTHYSVLPDPRCETLAEWLNRATDLYRQRAQITGRTYRPIREDTFLTHCDWFVQVHVMGVRPSRVAGATDDAVEKATKKIAALLRLQRRRWPRGGSRKKS